MPAAARAKQAGFDALSISVAGRHWFTNFYPLFITSGPMVMVAA